MLVSEVIRKQARPVKTILETQSMQEAIDVLVELRIGSLLAVDAAGQIAGIITERDILRHSFSRSPRPERVAVRDVMTRELVCGSPGDTITHLLQVMTQRRIRHLPIMRAGKLDGLVSIGDLVAAQFDQVRDENHHLKEYIQGSGAVAP